MDINEIIKMYDVQKLGINKISKQFKINIYQIIKILKNNNIRIRGKNEIKIINIPSLKEQEIIRLYNSNKSIGFISKKLNITKYGIVKFLDKNNIKIRHYSEQQKINRKYKYNEDLFDSLDSWEKLYILGFLFSDGYNAQDKGLLTLKLQKRDFYILKKIYSFFIKGHNRKFNTYLNKKTGKQDISFRVRSKKICNRLSELGCTQRKSLTLEFPEHLVENKFFNAFILGYFDGDGSASFGSCNGKWKKLSISYICSNKFSQGISKFLIKKLNINSTITNGVGCMRVEFSGTESLLKIYEYMYRNAPMFLKRKYKKFLEFFKYKKKIDKNFIYPIF